MAHSSRTSSKFEVTMADLSQVRDTIAQNLVTPIYPNGTNQPSIAGVAVTINAGWPIRTNLDKQLQLGNAMVSVYPMKQERVLTPFQRIFEPNIKTLPTLTATATTNSVTIGGLISIPQSVMIIVNGTGYAYKVINTDTLNSIADALSDLIPGSSANLNVISIPNAYSIIGRVSSNYSASAEIARVDRVFMITIWSPNENIRFILGNAIDVYMKLNYRIQMVDNFFAQVFYHNTDDTDMLDKSLIYRRDLNYTIQYATTVTENFMTVTDPVVQTNIILEA